MYIVYYETENHYNSKVHAIVRMANFKVIRNLVSESLYEIFQLTLPILQFD
jgi:hypothetical protein